MFPPPWEALPDFVAHDWPPYQGEQTLAEVAQRVCEEYSIRDDDTIVGASLGGMVACEVARLRRVRVLFLVGSATSRSEVSHLLEVMHPLADVAPLEWLRALAGTVPGDLAQMFSTAEAPFIRAMCRAIFTWEGLRMGSARCYRLHGRNDRVIPPPGTVDLLLRGGHLISITHARECAEFVRARGQGPTAHGQ